MYATQGVASHFPTFIQYRRSVHGFPRKDAARITVGCVEIARTVGLRWS